MEGKILIVDDDLDTLQLVGTMLEKQGLEIVAAGNGAQAIEVAKRALPDLVLLDIMMPGMDGYEVARQLKSHEPTSTIPIIMFTAKAQVEDKVAGFAAGVDDYLTKPIHPKELVARVKKILSDHKILLPQPPAPATSPPPPQDAATQTPPPPPVMARQPDDTLVSAASAVQAPRSTGQVIGVIGAKGGLGVSTISLNLGISIHQQTGADVLVAEMRPGQGDIGIYLGYPQPEGMNKLLYYKETIVRPSDIEEQWIEHDSGVKLLMTSFFPRDALLMEEDADTLRIIIRHFPNMVPYTILDLGTGLPSPIRDAVNMCDDIVVLVEPTEHTITHTKALLSNLAEMQVSKNEIKLVLNNRVRMDLSVPIPDIPKRLGHNFAGIINPAPELFYQASLRRLPAILYQSDSLAAKQIMKLAETITIPIALPS